MAAWRRASRRESRSAYSGGRLRGPARRRQAGRPCNATLPGGGPASQCGGTAASSPGSRRSPLAALKTRVTASDPRDRDRRRRRNRCPRPRSRMRQTQHRHTSASHSATTHSGPLPSRRADVQCGQPPLLAARRLAAASRASSASAEPRIAASCELLRKRKARRARGTSEDSSRRKRRSYAHPHARSAGTLAADGGRATRHASSSAALK